MIIVCVGVDLFIVLAANLLELRKADTKIYQNLSDEILYDRVSPRRSCLMTPEISVEKGGKESSDLESCSVKLAESTSALGCSKSEELSTRAEPMHLDTEVVSFSELPNGRKAPSPLENLEADCRDQDDGDRVESRVALTLKREISICENGSASVEGDGSNGCREEMVDIDDDNGKLASLTAPENGDCSNGRREVVDADVVSGELGSSTATENGVYCNGKALGAPIPHRRTC